MTPQYPAAHGTTLRPSLAGWVFFVLIFGGLLAGFWLTARDEPDVTPPLIFVVAATLGAVLVIDLVRRRSVSVVLAHDSIHVRRRFGEDLWISRHSAHGELGLRRRGRRRIPALVLRSGTHRDEVTLSSALWSLPDLEKIAAHAGIEAAAGAAGPSAAGLDAPRTFSGELAQRPSRSGVRIGVIVAILVVGVIVFGAISQIMSSLNAVNESLRPNPPDAPRTAGADEVSEQTIAEQDDLLGDVIAYLDRQEWGEPSASHRDCNYPQPGFMRMVGANAEAGGVRDYAFGEALADHLTNLGAERTRVSVSRGEHRQLEVVAENWDDGRDDWRLTVTADDDRWAIRLTSGCEPSP